MDSSSNEELVAPAISSEPPPDNEPEWVRLEREQSRRARLPIYIALGIAALLLFPIAAFPIIGLGALGFAMVKSALTHRGEGWVFGAGLGAFFLAITVGVALWAIGYRLLM